MGLMDVSASSDELRFRMDDIGWRISVKEGQTTIVKGKINRNLSMSLSVAAADEAIAEVPMIAKHVMVNEKQEITQR